ncbi:phage GP46 family protein [Variovorax sp. E3]|uniref:phage GP46 family protein n=1 Tax=Variovorax sp. E3 TaxID=1914993 RepID=UPI0018DBCB8B|nr:phage GP46 family protein [Variovorax sp. E3]
MFDVATRPSPSSDASAALGVPFDWRLTPPAPASAYPWTDFASSTGVPQPYVEVLQTYALELEDTFSTAIVISLFTDARAGRDDKLPLNQTDRRGWIGDEFMGQTFDTRGDRWGNLLWLYYITKVQADILEAARFTAQESLDWMVRDGLASRVTVSTLWTGPDLDRLAVRPTIYQADQTRPVYDVLWGTSLRKAIR